MFHAPVAQVAVNQGPERICDADFRRRPHRL